LVREYKSIQREYNAQRGNIIKEWTRRTEQDWPRDANGTAFQAHHIIPQRYGGPNEWWNIQPIAQNAHQGGIHARGTMTTQTFPNKPLRLP